MENNNFTQTLSKDEKTWGMLCHISSFGGFIIPLGNIFGPLIVWLIKKDEYAFADHHGKESLNFQISLLLYGIAAIALIIYGSITETWLFLVLGILAMVVIMIADIILIIVASVKANNGEYYRYPFTISFLS